MNELDLIAKLTRDLPGNPSVIAGAGDDCAVLEAPGKDELLLFKTDAVVEGVHFTKEAPPGLIGRKAIGRCLSDIAAMAGTPLHAVVTIGLPPGFDLTRIEGIYGGMSDLARRHHVAIVGGETVTSPERTFLSIALLGKVARGKCLFRNGAKAGDALFVTGELGGSILGKHLEFEPRLEEGRWLAHHYPIHAMIDVSDGLASDLRHIIHSSGTGAELLAGAIPISRAARLQAKAGSTKKPPLLAALTDGEDFELLFSVPSKDAVRLLDGWKRQFPRVRLSCIGKTTAEPGLRLRSKDGTRNITEHGFVHFQ